MKWLLSGATESGFNILPTWNMSSMLINCRTSAECIFERFFYAFLVIATGLTENAGHEIAGHANTGRYFARHDRYRMKIGYIKLEFAFLFYFKSFFYVRRVR